MVGNGGPIIGCSIGCSDEHAHAIHDQPESGHPLNMARVVREIGSQLEIVIRALEEDALRIGPNEFKRGTLLRLLVDYVRGLDAARRVLESYALSQQRRTTPAELEPGYRPLPETTRRRGGVER